MKRFIVLLQDVGCSEQLLKRGFVQKLFPRRADELLRQIGPANRGVSRCQVVLILMQLAAQRPDAEAQIYQFSVEGTRYQAGNSKSNPLHRHHIRRPSVTQAE